jgi:transcriptional regulator with XRE-family HTH domain
MSDIKKALRVALAQRGWKQQDLANIMSVTSGAVNHWVSSDRSMTMNTINRIADGLGMKTSSLIELGE